MIFNVFISLVVGAGLGVGVFVLAGFLHRRALAESLSRILFLVRVSREIPVTAGSGSAEKDFKAEIGKTEQLFSNLAAFKKPFILEVAVPHVGEEIHFYLSVQRSFAETAVKQIQGLWNSASVTETADDYNIFNSNGAVAGAYILQKEDFALPVRTYQEIGADTFASVVGALAKISEVGEGAALQVVVEVAPEDAKKKIHGYLNALKKGEPLKKVFGHQFPLRLQEIHHALSPQKEEKEKQEKVVDEDAAKALEAKIAKPLFRVNVRLLASAPSLFQANDILDGFIAGFSQFAAPRRNQFKIVKVKNIQRLAYGFSFRNFEPSQAMILNAEELASLYHLPIASTETPRIKWLKSKEAPPPDNLPAVGTRIGYSQFRGQQKPIFITDEDRRRHVYIVGQTGTGKSTLLGNMILEDIKRGQGVAIIDPHGDLTENALGHIPPARLDDLVYFSPGDLTRPLGLNMLEHSSDRPEERTFIVNEMQSIFNKLFPPETMGPMFEQYMRNALLLLMEDMVNEPATLTEVPRIFTDVEFRRRKLARIHNPVVIDFWEKEAIKAGGEASLANMTPYITSKFNNFISNDYMRPIIGQPKSAFNFRQIMDEGKILLVNLAKGRIGEINANLLGMVFTGKILMAALSRVDLPGEKRRDFNLYVDEFQNFTTDSIAIILSEARKYRLTLTIAHQFIAQLTEKIRDSVFGNVGSQIVFRVGAQDAEFLVKQFEPVFSQNDLLNIDNFNAHVRLLINGETGKPFNMHIGMESLETGSSEAADKLREYSRLKYGQDRHRIEEDIFKRLRT